MKLRSCFLLVFFSFNIFATLDQNDSELMKLLIKPSNQELKELTDFVAKNSFGLIRMSNKNQLKIKAMIGDLKYGKDSVGELNIALRGENMPLSFFLANQGYDNLLIELAEKVPLTMLGKFKGQNILEYLISHRHGLVKMNLKTQNTARTLMSFLRNKGVINDAQLFFIQPYAFETRPILLSQWLIKNGYVQLYVDLFPINN